MSSEASHRAPAPAVDAAALSYDERGLVPVVVQDAASGAVLMVAWADREAVERTLASGEAWFWSRSRRRLWRKGETSGHGFDVVSVTADCDADTLLVRAHPRGPACHRGTRTCFEPNPAQLELGWLSEVLGRRATADPDESYTARLLAAGLPKVAQKVGEEAVETILAAVTGSGGRGAVPGAGGERDDGGESGESDLSPGPLVEEAADLLYHLLVLLLARGVEPAAVARELARRHTAAEPTGGTP